MRPRKGRLDMRVTKAQAEQNRAHIVATPPGCSGSAAMSRCRRGRTDGSRRVHPWRVLQALPLQGRPDGRSVRERALADRRRRTEGLDPAEFADRYVSREHRDGRSDGCTIAALGGDAARQPADIKQSSQPGSRTC